MLYAIYFIYGLCVMFYFMMSWLFYRKDKKLLSRLVAVMMFVIGLQCLKDLFFIKPFTEIDELDWMVITAADMIVAPLYAHRVPLLRARRQRVPYRSRVGYTHALVVAQLLSFVPSLSS
jgi:putative effector of murein hydrolase